MKRINENFYSANILEKRAMNKMHCSFLFIVKGIIRFFVNCLIKIVLGFCNIKYGHKCFGNAQGDGTI
ncbi:hypothetical protein D7V86_15140 [bacterium D16-51]|nr:hypothetical protein D7V96_20555 [bacterium D16-59]RKI58760.1 hypothetical protein D7V86_15140 [bacterium D16-51]